MSKSHLESVGRVEDPDLAKILNPTEKIVWCGRPEFWRSMSSFTGWYVFVPFTLLVVASYIIIPVVWTRTSARGTPMSDSGEFYLTAILAFFWLMYLLLFVAMAWLSTYLSYFLTNQRMIIKVERARKGFKIARCIWPLTFLLYSGNQTGSLVAGQFILIDLAWVSTIYMRPILFGLVQGADLIFDEFVDSLGGRKTSTGGEKTLSEFHRVEIVERNFTTLRSDVPLADRFAALHNAKEVVELIVSTANTRKTTLNNGRD